MDNIGWITIKGYLRMLHIVLLDLFIDLVEGMTLCL